MSTVQDIYKMNVNDETEYIKRKQKLLYLKELNKIQEDYSTIENEYISVLCFNETLIVVNEKKEEIGQFSGKIRTKNLNMNNQSIMINLHSKNKSTHNKEIEMSVIAITTSNFRSYEEKWSRWNSNESTKTSKTVLISKKNNNEPILFYTKSNSGKLIDQTKNMNLKYIASLLTEGMNYAFLRYLAIKGYEGFIKDKTAITIDGILCKTIYKCTLRENYEINNAYVPVTIIKRFLKVDKSLKTPVIEMTTVLTRLGYILKHTWGKTINEELKIKKSMRVTKDGFVFNDTLLCLKENWDQDILLSQMYFDKVLEMKMKYENYMKNNREVKNMITSYIKAILIAKPDNLDVLEFSINYFKNV